MNSRKEASSTLVKTFASLAVIAIFGGLVAWGALSAKDKWDAHRAEVARVEAEEKADLDTARSKCVELCGELTKYVEANKDNKDLKPEDMVKAMKFIVEDEQDPWGKKYVLVVGEDIVTVSSAGHANSEEGGIAHSTKIVMPKKSMWDRAKGLFK